MKHAEKITPVAAAVTALSTLICCLPVGFAAAAATASLGVVIASYQRWFVGASLLLLAVGALQLRQARRSHCSRGSSSLVVLCVSAAIVLTAVFFPQMLAGLLADWLP
jgi:hypothetical protein